MPVEEDLTTCDHWWEFNKNAFLDLRRAAQAPVQTGSDDFYLGATRRQGRDTLRPTTQQAVDTVLPVLKRCLDSTSQRDITSACMIAMAKIGQDHRDFTLCDVFEPRLVRGDQEVRETAALAIGIAGQADDRSLRLLSGLVLDDAVGRAASGGEVNARTRAFAGYALGLTAHASRSLAVKQRVFEALRQIVESDRLRERNTKIAAIHGIGLLGLGARDYGTVRLLDEAIGVLEAYFVKRLGAGDEWVQAHCPTAMAKLAGSGHASRCQRRFVDCLAAGRASDRRGNGISQSCALALGELVAPHESQQSPDAVASEPDRSRVLRGRPRC